MMSRCTRGSRGRLARASGVVAPLAGIRHACGTASSGTTLRPRPAWSMQKMVVVWPTSCTTAASASWACSAASIRRRLPEAWSSSTSGWPARSLQATWRLRASLCVAGQTRQKGSLSMVSQCRSSRPCGSMTTPKSTSPLRTLCSTSLWMRSSSSSSMPGACSRQRAMQRGIRWADSVGLLATRTLPRRWVARPLTSSRHSSSASSTRVAWPCSRRPASVSSTSRVVRCKSCTPRACSSSVTLRLTAGWVSAISSPARLKLRLSATARKARSWRRLIFIRKNYKTIR